MDINQIIRVVEEFAGPWGWDPAKTARISTAVLHATLVEAGTIPASWSKNYLTRNLTKVPSRIVQDRSRKKSRGWLLLPRNNFPRSVPVDCG